MSSIKKRKNYFNIQSFKRQSFSERICDDFCEVILQYLPLKDKLRLECVSKQFQNTVFQKHNDLIVETNNIESQLFKNNSCDFKSFESLLKKCPFIKSINFSEDYLSGFDYNKVIHLITRYCNYLIGINAPLSDISVDAFKEFHQKFGSKMKLLQSIKEKEELVRLNEFPNLEELVLVEKLTETLSEFMFNKLKTFRIAFNDIEFLTVADEDVLKSCINQFKTVRYLEFSNFQCDEEILKSVSNLKQLIHLEIERFIAPNMEVISQSFKQLADNCPKLKSIDCGFDRNFGYGYHFQRLLSSLKAFKQLKRLNLRFIFIECNYSNENPMNIRNFSFEAFDGFSNITHLCLKFPNSFKYKKLIDEQFLTNIEIYLPNLQYFDINSLIFRTTPKGTNEITDIMSRLSNLETIRVRVLGKFIESQIKEQLIRKCKKIRRVDVSADGQQ